MIEILHRHLERIVQHAEACYPHECCGILVGKIQGRTRVTGTFETENVEPVRGRDRYRIHDKDFFRVDKIAGEEGLEIIGFYHSHPDGPPLPSMTDLKCAWEGYSYLIVSLQEGETPKFSSWRLDRAGERWIKESIWEREKEGTQS